MKRLAPLLTTLTLLLPACSTTGSAPIVARGTEPMTNHDDLVFYCAGLEALMPDARDAGLLGALRMLDDRLLELAADAGADFPAPVGRVAFDMLGSEMSLRVNLGDWSEGPQVRAQLNVDGEDADLERMQEVIGGLLARGLGPGAASGTPGLRAFEIPDPDPNLRGPIYQGVTGGEYVLAWGEPSTEPLGLGSLDLPRGVAPVMAFKFDMGALRQPLEMLMMMGGPEAAAMRTQFEMFGLLADQPLLITFAMGHGDDRSYWASRQHNWRALAEKADALVTEPLTRAELDIIPVDSTLAYAAKTDFSSLITMLDAMAPSEDVDILAEIENMIGVHVQAELIDHLGTTSGLYMSDTTGGGGLASTVAFISVTNEGGLAETFGALTGMLNDLAHNEADGRIQIRPWECRGATAHSLTFPGLPIPLELSYAIAGGYLFMAATPQALAGALDQMQGSYEGLLDSPRFRAVASGSLDDLQALSYTDLERTLADGYGWMGLLSSALANTVRSSSSPARDPGLVLPPYRELVEGVHASVGLTRIEGDDLVTVGQGDRSVTASLTGALGGPLGMLVVAGIGFAAVVPWMMLARSAAPPVFDF